MTASIQPLRTARIAESHLDLNSVAERLRVSREITHNIRQGGRIRELPATDVVMDVVDGLVTSLFPTHLGPAGLKREGIDSFVSNTLYTVATRLADQVRRGLQFESDSLSPAEAKRQAQDIANAVISQLPDIRATLVSDLKAALEYDPSAGSIAEILLCYRSSTAIIHYRIAHALHVRGARLVARVISDLAHATTGIDIHPGASIGGSFFIDRGTGIVIGETAVIGENVRLHQGVTLGASEFTAGAMARPGKGEWRHPIVENDVVIHSGATILGRITIGKGSVIGGNVWLTRSVAAGSIVTQAASKRGDVPDVR